MKKKMIYLRIWGQMRPGVFLFHIYFKQNTNETHGIIIENGLNHPSIRAGYQVSGRYATLTKRWYFKRAGSLECCYKTLEIVMFP